MLDYQKSDTGYHIFHHNRGYMDKWTVRAASELRR